MRPVDQTRDDARDGEKGEHVSVRRDTAGRPLWREKDETHSKVGTAGAFSPDDRPHKKEGILITVIVSVK